MTIFIIQLLNSFFYAAVLFLIAAGLSLIYGVMRIVNLAHGALYALGAYVSAWVVGGAVGHAASGTLGLAGAVPAGASDGRGASSASRVGRRPDASLGARLLSDLGAWHRGLSRQ